MLTQKKVDNAFAAMGRSECLVKTQGQYVIRYGNGKYFYTGMRSVSGWTLEQWVNCLVKNCPIAA